MPTDTAADNNGRVTVAIIGQRLDALIAQNEKFLDKFERHLEQAHTRDRELALLRRDMDDIECDVRDHTEKIEKIDTREKIWSGANSILATIAGILGGAGLRQ
jgi:hypothetical protein